MYPYFRLNLCFRLNLPSRLFPKFPLNPLFLRYLKNLHYRL
jgi:hypothetical protein